MATLELANGGFVPSWRLDVACGPAHPCRSKFEAANINHDVARFVPKEGDWLALDLIVEVGGLRLTSTM